MILTNNFVLSFRKSKVKFTGTLTLPNKSANSYFHQDIKMFFFMGKKFRQNILSFLLSLPFFSPKKRREEEKEKEVTKPVLNNFFKYGALSNKLV